MKMEAPSGLVQPGDGAAPMCQIRALHLINGESYAGAERVQDLLGQRLPELGVAPTLVALKPREFAARRRSDCELMELPMRSRFDLRPALQLIVSQRHRGWSIVHTHTPRAAMIGALLSRWTGMPLVHHVHSPTARDSANRWRNRLNCTIEGLAMRHAHRVLAVSPSLEDYVRQNGVDASRVRRVMNGVPTPGPLVSRSPPSVRAVIGCTALFRERKGLGVLLHAFAKLLPSPRMDLELRVVGGFESEGYESRMHRMAAELGIADRVQWRGFRADVNAELTEMDVFVLPSVYGEGMPMALLEAMAAGVPCVASAVEGIPTLLDEGLAGLLCQPGDADALAACLQQLLGTPALWSDLRARAYARQCRHFSDRSMASGVANVYAEVLAA